MVIKRSFRILFQGDSVTDCSRVREVPEDMGRGYPNFVSAWFNAENPEIGAKFFNRGISGNRVRDLKARWQEDCIDLKPDAVSILIGVNDTWRRFDECKSYTPASEFKKDYHCLLSQVREKLNAKIILCEPFLIPFTEEQRTLWREDLDPKIEAVRELAAEFEAILVPLDKIFTEAALKQDKSFWVFDGVHPNQNGHALVAQSWLKAVLTGQ
ncbi:MAG: SGNH/GDSL hydrolase family protein [Eubacteriales bacterium]|nr:SGNH/GDSL hydrolase family protein [Eubacteriales bacterium]